MSISATSGVHGEPYGLGALGRVLDLVAVELEDRAEQLARIPVVVDDEDTPDAWGWGSRRHAFDRPAVSVGGRALRPAGGGRAAVGHGLRRRLGAHRHQEGGRRLAGPASGRGAVRVD